jgi:cell wall assembly regulator SMI1
MKTIWDRIHFWFHRNATHLLGGFQPGASEEEIRRAEEALGVRLPEDVKAAYRIHNGDNGRAMLVNTDEWLSLERMVKHWCQLKDRLARDDFAWEEGEPDGPIRTDYWHPLWIPVLWDTIHNYNCIDLAPEKGGSVGQVIYCPFDEEVRTVVASGFTEWLGGFALDLEQGIYTTRPGTTGLIFSDEA